MTTRCGRPSISGSSEGRCANSPYASSTTTIDGPAACAASYSATTVSAVDGGAGRVVRRAEEDDVGPVLGDARAAAVGVEGEVLAARPGDPAGAGAAGDERVHRVRRLEAQRGAAGPAEGLQQLLDDLVGAVGRPDLARRRPRGRRQVGGQLGAQLDRVPVGVAVERRGRPRATRSAMRRDQRLGQRVRVLVGVQPHGHVELRARRTGTCRAARPGSAGRRAGHCARGSSPVSGESLSSRTAP